METILHIWLINRKSGKIYIYLAHIIAEREALFTEEYGWVNSLCSSLFTLRQILLYNSLYYNKTSYYVFFVLIKDALFFCVVKTDTCTIILCHAMLCFADRVLAVWPWGACSLSEDGWEPQASSAEESGVGLSLLLQSNRVQVRPVPELQNGQHYSDVFGPEAIACGEYVEPRRCGLLLYHWCGLMWNSVATLRTCMWRKWNRGIAPLCGRQLNCFET